MLRHSILSALLASAVVLASAQTETPAAQNGAAVERFATNIGDFTEVTVANNINVVYKSVPDSAGMAVFECSRQTASAITFRNDKEKLKIEVISDTPLANVPTVTIYSLALVKATNWGDSTITVINPNPGSIFKAKVIGNGEIIATGIRCTRIDAAVEAGSGHIYLTGKAQRAKYTIMSAGSIEAGELEAAEVKSVMLGTGSIDCYATEKLNIVGAGSGKIFYRGDPEMKNIGIGVKAVKME